MAVDGIRVSCAREDGMRFGVLGTGMVGRAIGSKLSELDHEVAIGTRDVEALMARAGPDARGNQPFSDWSRGNPQVRPGTLADVSAEAEIVVNVTSGAGSLEALNLAGASNLDGKIVIDIANPLQLSGGVPTLLVANTDSLAERIQRSFPDARVVKTLNTVNARVMVAPAQVANGDHHVFVSGDDGPSKAQVSKILQSFGWKHIIDLGGIVTARATEMYLPLWIALRAAMNTPMLNIQVMGDQETL
jgi:predicted dinucleotide-binding enzyme